MKYVLRVSVTLAEINFSVIGQSLVYIRSLGLVVTFGANQLRCRTVEPEGLFLNKMAKGVSWSGARTLAGCVGPHRCVVMYEARN